MLAAPRLDRRDVNVDTGARCGRGYRARSAAGSVTVPGVAIARRVASARYALGSRPTSFADSIKL